jgi:hypothetical protein
MMNRQSVVVFTCPVAVLADTVMDMVGGLEIESISHAHVDQFVVSVVLVIKGERRALQEREREIRGAMQGGGA